MTDDSDLMLEKLSSNAVEAAGVLRALSNPARLMLLCKLVEGEKTVRELEQALELSQAYVSQQLARLRDEGLVAATRDGRQMRYRLEDPRVTPVIEVLYREYCA